MPLFSKSGMLARRFFEIGKSTTQPLDNSAKRAWNNRRLYAIDNAEKARDAYTRPSFGY